MKSRKLPALLIAVSIILSCGCKGDEESLAPQSSEVGASENTTSVDASSSLPESVSTSDSSQDSSSDSSSEGDSASSDGSSSESSLDSSSPENSGDEPSAPPETSTSIPEEGVPDTPPAPPATTPPTTTTTPASTTPPPNNPPIDNTGPLRFSAESGVYPAAFDLVLAGAGTIYYTLDGSDPATSKTRIKYTAPIPITDRKGDKNVIAAVEPILFSGNFCRYNGKKFTSTVSKPSDSAVDKCTVVRAVSQGNSGKYSETLTATYYIGKPEDHIKGIAESCAAAGTSLAVISITMNYDDLFDSKTGIYVKGDLWDAAFKAAKNSGQYIDTEASRRFNANYHQRGRDWERLCHIDFFEMDANGAKVALSQNCGIRIQGNYSRSDLQKGFRLFAREEYGAKRFKYPVFGSAAGVDSFKTLILRAGGNCAFTAKFNDTYWQTVAAGMACSTKSSRPCVVYINGEYFGLYVLEEDYSEHYFEDHYGVDDKQVVIYKGDAEKYSTGWYLDEGTLPDGVTDEGYFFKELYAFFDSHSNLKSDADYKAFEKLVDIDSVRDYFLVEVWINNKWDWPGKNWSMWKTATNDGSKYGDGRWRFMFYDMEFGGVSGKSDISTNTVKEDNYKPKGLLDMDTRNPAVLCFAYLMTNEGFRNDFCSRLTAMSDGAFSKSNLTSVLNKYIAIYSPLYKQFFERYPDTGSKDDALYGGYASAQCIKDFIGGRGAKIPSIVNWINKQF